MLLLVDELDRCRPEYAVRLLKEMKALFVRDRIVVVHSANLDQLAKVISGKYGEGFDGSRYLDRFFDLKVPLSTASE